MSRRIRRNDAPPLQIVNLVSEDEKRSSQSSSSPSSSDSDDKSNATPSSLSDFIEEDDGQAPLPRSSSSSWQPVKRRRKPIRTLRKRPRVDSVDADEERSTTSSVSSDGIPTPDVEADADDEEGNIESPSPRYTPSKRRRPRREAAPRCFLDALNKYVEPMSKQANAYTSRTMHEIWHDDSDSDSDNQTSEQASDDSSLEYVPLEREEHERHDQRGENNTVSLPVCDRRPAPYTNSYQNETSHVIPSDNENAAVEENTVETENAKDVQDPQSPPPLRRRRRSLIDMSDTEEDDIPLSTVLETKKKELQHRNEGERDARQATSVQPQHTGPVFEQQPEVEELIDLVGDHEYEVHMVKEYADDFNNDNTLSNTNPPTVGHNSKRKNAQREHAVHGNQKATRQENEDDPLEYHFGEDQSLTEEDEKGTESKQEASNGSEKTTTNSNMKQENISFSSANPNRRAIHERNACQAAILASALNAESEARFDADPELNSEYKLSPNSKGASHGVKREFSYETHGLKTNGDRCKDFGDSNGMMSGGGQEHCYVSRGQDSVRIQTIERSISFSNSKDIPSSLSTQKVRPKFEFRATKPRGQALHPDKLKGRVPQSESEKDALREFVKAEARKMYRAFTAEPPARTFKCTNTDVTFIRQVLAEVGKIMGLKVTSEWEPGGRRIVLQLSPLGKVGGCERDVEQAAEGFFDTALDDLTRDLRYTHQSTFKNWKTESAVESNKKHEDEREANGNKQEEHEKTFSPLPRSSRKRYFSSRKPWKTEKRKYQDDKRCLRTRRESSDGRERDKKYRHGWYKRRKSWGINMETPARGTEDHV